MSAGKKVVIIDDAHKMTAEAQNCILKTLEEPPPDSLLILVTSRKELLFETIVSRCQVVGFSRLTKPEIADAARQIVGKGYEHEDLLMSLSENCPGRLLELGLTGMGNLIGCVRNLFDEVAQGRLAAVFPFSRRVLDEGGSHRRKTRLAVRQALELVIFWIVEIIRVQHGHRAEIEGSEFAGALKGHSKEFDEVALLAASRHLETSLSRVNLNVDMALLLQATLLRTARILHPEKP
jgi:DNA polymerase-3 subunit delta'